VKTDDKLIDAIKYAEEQAESSSLQSDRQEAMAYYNGDAFGNEVAGRSQVVSRDVHDTIEWIKPSLLKMFASGDEVVKFNPVGAEDVEAAEQETEYINHIFMQKNDGFMILHDWFHDALLLKNAYVKAEWDVKETEETERYEGLMEEQVALIMQDKSVEVVAADTDEYGLYSIDVKRKKEYGCVKYKVLPPEQCRVSHSCDTVSVTEADFFQHWDWVSLSSLRESGFKIDDDVNDGEASDYTEWLRSQQADSPNYGEEGYSADPSMRKVKCKWSWIRFDKNKDGKAELLYVISVGKEVLLSEGADVIPVAALCPAPSPHRHNGWSVADGVMDLQLIKSTMLRGYFDNLYLTNNGRYAISSRVNLSDMLQSRPGGVIRVEGDPNGAIMPLVHPQAGAAILQGIEYIDALRENRTGVTRYNQGIDANSLNKTASGITQIMSASQQRIELIARVFAEGVKTLFWITHKITKQNATQPETIRLRNSFIPIDPREWKTRNDLTISVGLGNGNKDQQLVHLQTILGAQAQGMAIGIATPKNIYNAVTKLTENAGFKDTESFWTDPEKAQPQPPKQDPAMAKIQAEAQYNQQKLELDKQVATGDMALEKWKAEQQMLLEKYKAELKAQSDFELQNMKASMQQDLQVTKLQMDAHRESVTQMHDIAIKRSEHDESTEALREERQTKLLESMAAIADKMSKPKVATLSNGKKVRIDSE
jgi:hypothetical protein